MTALAQPTAYPLCWPPGWDRTTSRVRSKFAPHTRLQAAAALRKELERLGAEGVLISTNAVALSDREPDDPGAAVYFTRRRGGKPQAYELACDRFTKLADNLWALACHVENMRQSERYGVATVDRALRAYAALPAPAAPSPATPPAPPAPAPARRWHEVLRCREDAAEIEIRAAFQARVSEQHPDAGGAGDMAALARARDEGLAARRGAVPTEARR